MIDVVSAAGMRESDAAAIASGTPGRVLMERAGRAIFDAVRDDATVGGWKAPVGVVCGCGNNAGDGYVLADRLHSAGLDVTLIRAEDKFSPDGRYFYEKAVRNGVNDLLWKDGQSLSGYPTLVDCLFGTGFRGNADRMYAQIIRAINDAGERGAGVIAADIPSGLGGENGQGDPIVKADLTCSVGTAKSGHFLGRAKDFVGRRIDLDIGIPIRGERYGLLEASDFAAIFPPRRTDCNKGDFGTVALIGGCADYSGAAKLANLSLSALRAGCGVAKLVVPGCIKDAVLPYLLESTLFTLPDRDGFAAFDPCEIDRALWRVSAAAVGMGWGQGGGNRDILAYILDNAAIPLVIDADGLNLLAKIGLERLKTTRCRVILTPHLLEFERLSGIPRENVLASPIDTAMRFAKEYRVILLLKGPTTILTDGSRVLLCDRGCPGMATAGSGDVLSGILAGILGHSRDDLLLAAGCGAWIGGRAGEIAQSRVNPVSMIASDTVAAIPSAVSEILAALSNKDHPGA